MQTHADYGILKSQSREPLSSKGAKGEESKGITRSGEQLESATIGGVRRNAFEALTEIRVHSTSSFPTICGQYVPAEMVVYWRRNKMGERSRCKRSENDSYATLILRRSFCPSPSLFYQPF